MQFRLAMKAWCAAVPFMIAKAQFTATVLTCLVSDNYIYPPTTITLTHE